MFENKPMTGQIYPNSSMKSDKSPTHGGTVNVEGVDYWFKGWSNPGSWEMHRIVLSPKNASDSKKDGIGVITFNTAKKTDQEADLGGSVNIEGKKYWLNCWLNEDRQGNLYLSVVIKERKNPGLNQSVARSGKTTGFPSQQSRPDQNGYVVKVIGDPRWH